MTPKEKADEVNFLRRRLIDLYHQLRHRTWGAGSCPRTVEASIRATKRDIEDLGGLVPEDPTKQERPE